jgi:hypothetical protein
MNNPLLTEIPYPGSANALKQGCICPVMDNCHGQGINGKGTLFWMNADCPLHGIKPLERKMRD